jgi:hypothetical protein
MRVVSEKTLPSTLTLVGIRFTRHCRKGITSQSSPDTFSESGCGSRTHLVNGRLDGGVIIPQSDYDVVAGEGAHVIHQSACNESFWWALRSVWRPAAPRSRT